MNQMSQETGIPQSPIYVSAEGMDTFDAYIDAQLREMTENYIVKWEPPEQSRDFHGRHIG